MLGVVLTLFLFFQSLQVHYKQYAKMFSKEFSASPKALPLPVLLEALCSYQEVGGPCGGSPLGDGSRSGSVQRCHLAEGSVEGKGGSNGWGGFCIEVRLNEFLDYFGHFSGYSYIRPFRFFFF